MAQQLESNLAWECRSCAGRGVIDDPTLISNEPILVSCVRCGALSAYVWCSHCGVGGQIAETDFSTHPLEWSCQTCHHTFGLPVGFYDIHIRFTPTKFPHTSLFRPRRREDELPQWILALERRWKHWGEPLMVVCVIVLLFSLLGLGLTFNAGLGEAPIIIFYTFIVVFSSLVAGVFVWGGITALFKWIMLHTAPEKPKRQPREV